MMMYGPYGHIVIIVIIIIIMVMSTSMDEIS